MRLAQDKPEELQTRVSHVLRETPYSALDGVSCEILEGTVVLRGRVPSYFLKQVAQTAAASVADVREVINRIEVSGRTYSLAVD